MNLSNMFVLVFLSFIPTVYIAQEIAKQSLYVGQSVKLKCGPIDKFYNFPFTFKWEKPLGNVIGTQPILELKNVDFTDGGIYTCRVSGVINNKEIQKTLSTQLLIENRDSEWDPSTPGTPVDAPTIEFRNIKVENLELQETDYLYTVCDVKNWQKSDYTSKWLFNGRPINGASDTLYKTSLDSEKDSGLYTCEIFHKNFPRRKFEKQLSLTIKKPEIVIATLPGEDLKVGGRIYRKCEVQKNRFSSNEPLQYQWLKDDSIEVANSDTLDIRIMDSSVNGEYSCVVKSQKLNKKYTKPLNVQIETTNQPRTGKNKVNIFSQPTNPELNKEFKLKCEVYPQMRNVIYRWIKDSQFVSSDQTLIIPSFQRKDIGSYSCEISSLGGDGSPMGGKSSENIAVKFRYSTINKIELDESGSQMISRIGEKREMHCEIPSSSDSRGEDVRWYFNNRQVTSANKVQYNIYQTDRTFVSIITLVSITPQNEGQYTCEVDNIVKKANLIVIQDESSLTINPEKIIVNELQPVEFHCRGNNIINFMNTQIKWSFRSRDGSIYLPNLNADRRWEITNSPETPETSFISVPQSLYKDGGFYTCTTLNGLQKTAELIVKKREDEIVLTISPEIVRVRDNQPVIVECFSVSQKTGQPYGEPRFTMESGRSITQDSRITEEVVGQSRIRLYVKDGLQTSDNKMKVECHAGIQVKTAMIFLENQCPPNYRRCSNGQCQPTGKFCNGVQDCSDGSDEDPLLCNKCDPLVSKCQYHENKTPIKDIYLVHWRCDGENDCGNNFDEYQCSEDDNKCGNLKFNCSNGKVIPRAYQCDKEQDCLNGEDEVGCILPQVTTSRGDKVKRIRRGSSIELKCESYGMPRPFIVWRYNWGCLRDKIRMTVTTTIEQCYKTISTLRIMDFQPGDDGIYNCEALSGQNRGFSEDYQLILENN